MTEKGDLIAASLRSKRAAARETQTTVAAAVAVTPSTLSAWENSGCISLKHAWDLSEHYGVTIDQLAGKE